MNEEWQIRGGAAKEQDKRKGPKFRRGKRDNPKREREINVL